MNVSMPMTVTVPGLTDDEQALLNELVSQWRGKLLRNQLRTRFYEMKNGSRMLIGDSVPEIIKRRDFVLGWSGIAVDKLNRRCRLDGFYDAAGNDLASLGLNAVLDANRFLEETAPQAGTSSLIHAVSFLVTTQGAPGEPPVLVTAKDASMATGIWNARTRSLSSFLSINRVNESEQPTSFQMYLPNLIVTCEKDGDSGWQVERRAHRFGVPVDPLRYRPQLGRPFGSSRISRSVMSIHMQALAAMVRTDVNGEAYSLARYIFLGVTEEELKGSAGASKLSAAWKSVWGIPDDDDAANPRADVKQFTGQSPEPQIASIRMLAQMFSGETGIPVGELGIVSDANPTSSASMTVGKEDLISEAHDTTEAWSADVASAARRALTMLGDVPSNLDLRPKWRPPQFTSAAEAADAGMKTISALPWLAETDVGMELVGLTPDQITRAKNERRLAAGRETLAAIRSQADAVGA